MMRAFFMKMTEVLAQDMTTRPLAPILRVFIANSLQYSLVHRIGQSKTSTAHLIQGGFDIYAHTLIVR